jgi:uncharacterized tellurite resistance protein B-like protein
MDEFSHADRLRLVKFLCSFAWADLEVRNEERVFVSRVVQHLQLDDEDQAKVQGWLSIPPSPESVDPMLVPKAHRKVFLDSIEGVIVSDGVIAAKEQENFNLLKTLLA